MNKALLLLAMLLVWNLTNAQQTRTENNRLSLGVKLGGGVSSFTDPISINGLTASHASVNAGLAAFVPLVGRFSLQTELTWNIRMFKDENPDWGDHNFQIQTLECPFMLNTRIFNYEGNNGTNGVSLLTGFGFSRGLKSKILSDSKELKEYYGAWVEYEYRQVTEAFESVRKNNAFFVLGVNSRLLNAGGSSVGLRYIRFLKSVYELDKVTEAYDFTTQAYCISLDLMISF